MWFFAILLVLLMGGIAMVASGFGQPMSQGYDDRPDPLLPVGDIGAEDLRRTRFSLAFRGYRMSEVDALLDRLARQLDAPVPGEEAAEAAPAAPDPPQAPPPPLPRVRGEDDTP